MIPRIWGITGGGPGLEDRVVRALDAGLPALLLREPALPDGLLPRLARDADRVCLHARTPGAALLAAGLGLGLHLPGDADVARWRRRFAGRLGRSCHSPEEARRALAEGADYVFLSPIWAAASKPGDRRPPLGPAALAGLGAVIALGGVTPDRVAEARRAGAHGVAALGGIFGAEDVAAAARRYSDALASYDQM